MSEVKWIKITTTMFEDEKIDFIESLPEADSILVIWIKLLTLAGKCNMNGYIFLTENIPYTDEMLAHKFKRPINTVRLAIQTFKNLGMVDLDEQVFHISNWDKHQNIEGMERIRELTRKRVARHRETKLLESNVTCNATVTHGNATDIDIEEDKELDKEKDIEITPLEREILHIFSSIKLYKLDYLKDIQFIRQIFIDFPNINVLDEAKKWSVYKQDKPLTTKENPRSQFRNWCNNASKWQKERGVSSGGNRTSNLPFSLDERILAKQRERATHEPLPFEDDDLF